MVLRHCSLFSQPSLDHSLPKLHGVTNKLDTLIVCAHLRIAFVFEDRDDVTESSLFRHLRASEGLVEEASQPGNPHFHLVDPRVVAVRIRHYARILDFFVSIRFSRVEKGGELFALPLLNLFFVCNCLTSFVFYKTYVPYIPSSSLSSFCNPEDIVCSLLESVSLQSSYAFSFLGLRLLLLLSLRLYTSLAP
ncbi:hypothetical protein Tco_1466710 [Tanacetum coccineum]